MFFFGACAKTAGSGLEGSIWGALRISFPADLGPMCPAEALQSRRLVRGVTEEELQLTRSTGNTREKMRT